MTFIYGVNSWIDNSYGKIIQDSRPNSYTRIEIVENAGHKVFSDNETVFNRLVVEACNVKKTPKLNSWELFFVCQKKKNLFLLIYF